MKILNLLIYTLILSFSLSTTMVQAAENKDYEEVSYADLVDQLNQKNRQIIHASEGPFDKLKIHTGIGYINSFNNYSIAGKSEHRYQNGIQVSLGVDLFSNLWIGEVSFRNYGITTNGSEELLSREVDLKFGYHELLAAPIEFRMQGGIASRFIQIKDDHRGINISETSPAIMGSAGIGIRLNKMMTMGIDLSGHTAVLGRSIDKNSFDMIIEMKAAL